MNNRFSTFNGPIFLVGMPRSGTKLLRAILNHHPDISIPETETEFFPHWVANWTSYGDLSNYAVFQKFAARCKLLPYFRYKQDRKHLTDVERWYKNCRSFQPNDVFEALLKTDLSVSDFDDTIWGDKSPSYVTHIGLLKQHFPEARIIHIIRDVRDYCLSINKAWGKNMFRAAQRWNDDVSSARAQGLNMSGDYIEVKYEDLLDSPRASVQKICRFLGVDLVESMFELSGDIENLGDARGHKEILKSNTGKYKDNLSESKRRTIEAIAGTTLVAVGYDNLISVESKRLGKCRLSYYQGLDGIRLITRAVRERGIIGAVQFYATYFVVSGNRRS